MQEIYIKSATAILKLIAPENIISTIINDDFFYSYIPSVVIVHSTDIKTIDASITLEECESNILNINYPYVYYGYNTLNTKDIISLIEFILERARQEKGIICIHGAGSVVNNKLAICWGPATGMR